MIFYNFHRKNNGFSLHLIAGIFIFASVISACDQCKEEIDGPPPPPLRLDYMEVEESQTGGLLYLYGNFGDSTANAKVWINDLEISGDLLIESIVSWQSNLIKCTIPDGDYKDGAGKVYVSNNGAKSNVRTLNRWKGTIVFHRPDQGLIERSMWINVCLRADADPHKNIPYLFTPQSGFASSSKLQYSLGGQGSSTYSDDDCAVTMTANLESAMGWIKPIYPFQDRATEDNYFQSALRFTNGHFEVTDIDVFKKDVSTKTMTVQSCGGSSVYSSPHSLYGLPYELQTFNLEFEPNSKVIKSGQIIHKASTEMGLVWDNGSVPLYECFISWERMVPEF